HQMVLWLLLQKTEIEGSVLLIYHWLPLLTDNKRMQALHIFPDQLTDRNRYWLLLKCHQTYVGN
ncbi:MAG: hypothetical protein N4A72_19300, partial [Bacteroidales bacterium]|nr:hypothetical protein [Bacteroidales bacterium]